VDGGVEWLDVAEKFLQRIVPSSSYSNPTNQARGSENILTHALHSRGFSSRGPASRLPLAAREVLGNVQPLVATLDNLLQQGRVEGMAVVIGASGEGRDIRRGVRQSLSKMPRARVVVEDRADRGTRYKSNRPEVRGSATAVRKGR